MTVWNFSAGPALLPAPVLEAAQAELLNWQGRGVSVMEVSHRGAAFTALAEACERRLRELLVIPDDYAVLFVQGGASTQFALLPLNFAVPEQPVAFIDSGHWSIKARAEASLLRPCVVVERVGRDGVRHALEDAEGAAYCHMTANETVDGLEFPVDPPPGAIPWFCDFSSSLCSRPIDVRRYGLLYAGAQKNLGPAGITIVVVRKDLLARCPDELPTLLNHRKMAESGSMANTPPTFAWYLVDRVLAWLQEQGGLTAMERRNQAKADALYGFIDASSFYVNEVHPIWRSRMNVTFSPRDTALCADFVAQAEAAGLIGLKGHRAVGGLRASLYNAMPMDGVQALIDFMKDFEARRG